MLPAMRNEHGKEYPVLGRVDTDVGHSLKFETADKEPEGAVLEGMPVGKCDFKILRDRDLYYVDKSMIIH